MLAPDAPSFLAVNRETGKVVWQDKSPGDRILHGQWSSPSLGESQRRDAGGLPRRRRLALRLQRADGCADLAVRLEPERRGLAEDAQRRAGDAGVPRRQGLHGRRPGSRKRRGRRPPVLHRPDEDRRHHRDRPRVALRQDPAVDLDGGDRGRAAVHRGLQRLPALPRRGDRRAATGLRHAGGRVGVAARRRRQGVPRRRGRRCRRAAGGEDAEEARRDQHGQRRLQHARPRQRRALHHEPLAAVRHRRRRACRTPGNERFGARREAALSAVACAAALALEITTAARAQPGRAGVRSRPRGPCSAARRPSWAWPPRRCRGRWRCGGGTRRRTRSSRRPPSPTARSTSGRWTAHLHAVDLATGKARWQYRTAGPDRRSRRPACATASSSSATSKASCTRSMPRRARPAGRSRPGARFKSSPNCRGRLVYIGSYDQHLYCLDRPPPARWSGSLQTDGPVHATPALDAGMVYVAGCDEQLRAIDAATGRQRYAVPLGAYAGASAAIRDGHAYVGTFGNEVLAIDLARRAVRWTLPSTRPAAFRSTRRRR